MTGTPDAGSFSSALLAEKKMEFWRYPVHLNETQCRVLAEKTIFRRCCAITVRILHPPQNHHEMIGMEVL
ncbi:hypothetical protein NIA69_17330 [Gemmiger formicilis]|nr:hypothetical protein [Gemmiger formicilis]